MRKIVRTIKKFFEYMGIVAVTPAVLLRDVVVDEETRLYSPDILVPLACWIVVYAISTLVWWIIGIPFSYLFGWPTVSIIGSFFLMYSEEGECE